MVGSDMAVASFFQEDTDAALIQQVEWLEKYAQFPYQFFLNLLEVDQRAFFRWRNGEGELSKDAQDGLKEFWQMILHILSFTNFDLNLFKMMIEYHLESKPESVNSAFDPPWLGTSLSDYLQIHGIAGTRKVNQWVQTMRFGDSD
jgi:hypothetical protein